MLRLLLLALLLCGCNDDSRAPSDNGGAEVRAPISQRPGAQQEEKPPSPEEVAAAEKITAFANRVTQYLEHGFYSLADVFHANTQAYLKTFRLPARPDVGQRRPDALQPEAGLFNEQEARDLTAGWQAMDKALSALLGHYANLEKYVADRNIRDDGALGRELAERIELAHGQFIGARRSFLAIVQKAAGEAQRALLYNHPLARQILAAENIFAQMREAGDILASGSAEPELLRAICANIRAEMELGARPPFPAAPNLERLYRNYLKAVGSYAGALEQGSEEGMRQFQRREISESARASILAWNEFAKEANESAIAVMQGR